MITPFASNFGRQHTLEMTEDGVNPVFFTHDLCFLVAIEVNAENDDGLDNEIATQIWASACYYDALLCGVDYSAYCKGYENEYLTIVEKLGFELSRKKLLSKKPYYDIGVILHDAIDALDIILGVDCECELADDMRTKGIFNEWKNDISDLQNRLRLHAEKHRN